MLIEIPDPIVILQMIVVFFVGLLSFFIVNKFRTFTSDKAQTSQNRLDYYEKQLIDMKIKLDMLDLENTVEKNDVGVPSFSPEVVSDHDKVTTKAINPKKTSRIPNMDQKNAMTYVLGLITEKPMTSRDIQSVLGRTREHTSRLMKKLFEEGYVERNTRNKPYSYSITKKGLDKLETQKQLVQVPIIK